MVLRQLHADAQAILKERYPEALNDPAEFSRHYDVKTTLKLLSGFREGFVGLAHVKRLLRIKHDTPFDRELPDVVEWSGDLTSGGINAAKLIRLCGNLYYHNPDGKGVHGNYFPAFRHACLFALLTLQLLPPRANQSGWI